MKNKGLLSKLGLAAILAIGSSAHAGVIKVTNYGANYDYGPKDSAVIHLENKEGSTEGFDDWGGISGDITFFTVPYDYSQNRDSLEIYTKTEGYKLGQDSRPINTSGWDFYLSVNLFPRTSFDDFERGMFCNNSLKFEVIDSSDLLGKEILAYDLANPSVKHPIPTDGSVYTINLPRLANQLMGDNPYGRWRVDLPGPSALAILGLGAGFLTKRNNPRKKRYALDSKSARLKSMRR